MILLIPNQSFHLLYYKFKEHVVDFHWELRSCYWHQQSLATASICCLKITWKRFNLTRQLAIQCSAVSSLISEALSSGCSRRLICQRTGICYLCLDICQDTAYSRWLNHTQILLTCRLTIRMLNKIAVNCMIFSVLQVYYYEEILYILFHLIIKCNKCLLEF